MDSISPAINSIHAAYCEALGYQFNMMQRHERGWYDALKYGMTPDDVKLVIKNRQARIKIGVRRDECILWRNIAGSEDAISDVIEEAASLRARMRIKVIPSGKAEVLKATGRPTELEQSSSKPIGDYIKEMRIAAQ